MINTSSPYGTVNYAADPSAPGGYSQTTTFSPSQQGLYNSTVGAQQSALDIAGQQIGRVGDALGQGFDLSQQPSLQYGVQSGPIQTGFGSVPGQQTSFDQGQGVQGSLGPQGAIQGSFNQGQGVQGQVNPAGPIQTGVNLQTGFNPGQAVQGQIGPTDFNAESQRVSDAVYQQYRDRLDPYWQSREDRLQNRLANQGISQNNNTYGNALQTEARGRNDAYGQALYQAIQAGADRQNDLFGQSLAQGQFANQAAAQQYAQNQGLANFGNNAQLQQGQFANAAQGQQFGQNATAMQLANQAAAQQYAQNLGAAQFGNQAQQQGYEQDLGAGQFANQAAAQQYMQNQGAADFANQANSTQFAQNLAQGQFANAATGQQFNQDLQAAAQQNAARNQGVQEQAYQQNLPLNQFNSLMSSSQVQAPTGINYSPTGVANTDVLGAYALNQQAQQANYQAQMQQQNALLGGLSQLGGAALGMFKFSDRRLKRDIERVGTWKGHNLYSYRYLWDNEPQFGVMADEVMHTGAVHNVGGFLAVDYAAL